MAESQLRVLLADDHEVVREGLGAMIVLQPDMQIIGMAADGAAAVRLAVQLNPDVILMDLVMPQMDGVAAISAIKQKQPGAHILVLTSYADDERVFSAIKAGALGYLLKDAPRSRLLQAIRDVACGEPVLDPVIALKVIREINHPPELPQTTDPLTGRELDTLRQIAHGLSNQEIAAALGIRERTVAKHVSSILDKLHLANRTQAALYALQQKLAEAP